VLFPESLIPKTAVRLGNGKFAIYDVSYLANMGHHRWNVPASELKRYRAIFLLQRDCFYQDLIYYNWLKANHPEQGFFFSTWDGVRITSMPWHVVRDVIPAFLGELLVPSPTHPLTQKIVQFRQIPGYVSADGTIDVNVDIDG